jgi:hypothetical protein
LIATVRRIAADQQSRRSWDAHFVRMYGADPAGSGPPTKPGTRGDAVQFNLCASLVNTGKANIGAKRPRPRFVTNDGDWSAVKAAKACEYAVDGELRRSKFWEFAPMVFVDGAVSSLGAVKVFDDGRDVRCERVLPGQLLVDAREGYYGAPRNIYQVAKPAADAVKASFGGMKKAERERLCKMVDDSSTSSSARDGDLDAFDFLDATDSETETLLIAEGWHLPTVTENDKGEKTYEGGRHVIACASGVLLDEPWERDHFPFAFYRWEKRQFGFFGCGMVEEARPYQRAINLMSKKISDAIHTASRVQGQHVKAMQLDNDPATVIEVPTIGDAPRVISSNAVPSEWFAHRAELIQDCYRQFGFSEMMATGNKPAGLDSGEAQREYRDTVSQRLTDKMNSWDDFVLSVAELIIEQKTELAKGGSDKPVKVKTRRASGYRVEEIKWSELNLDDMIYMLETTPSSLLPDSSAGRVATATDWYQSGIIDAVEFKALLDIPDLERFKSLDLSAYRGVLDAVERMIEDGEEVLPEPSDDLELAFKLATQSYTMFKLRKAPEGRLELLRNYLTDVESLLDQAKQAAMAAQAPQSQQGTGAPGAMPPATDAALQGGTPQPLMAAA